MHELKNNLILNAYTDKADYGLKLIITLAYRTKDGKIHQIANTETTV